MEKAAYTLFRRNFAAIFSHFAGWDRKRRACYESDQAGRFIFAGNAPM
jgi:hypothetical protein